MPDFKTEQGKTRDIATAIIWSNNALELFQPRFEFLRCDDTCFALRFFLTGSLAPGIKCLPRELSSSDPRKASFIFTPVHDEQWLTSFALLPGSGRSNTLAGPAAVDGPVTISRRGPAPNDKISAAIFAYPGLYLLTDAFFKMKVNEVPNALRLQHFREGIRADELESE